MTKTEPFIERNLSPILQKWLDTKEALAIVGPRQSGKTTILAMLQTYLIEEKKVAPNSINSITFEDREILSKFAAAPKEYIQSFQHTKRLYFFIDEFQYLEHGGQVLKLLYDIFPNIKFIITGSSSLELKDKTGGYMVGRMLDFNLWQLNFQEFLRFKAPQNIYNAYQEKQEIIKAIIAQSNTAAPEKDIFLGDVQKFFNEFVLFGGYPRVVLQNTEEEKKVILKNIYDKYITKDIVELLKITDYEQFTSLVTILAAQIGNLLNLQNIAQETGSYFKELKKYINILEQTYIIKTLKPYYKNIITELKKNPKLYFIDTGLRNYIIQNFAEISLRPDKGALIENFVLGELIKYETEGISSLKFWRTTGKSEIDFISQKGLEILPIEVKYSLFTRPSIPKAFGNFIKTYNPRSALILTRDFWGSVLFGKTRVYFVPVVYV